MLRRCFRRTPLTVGPDNLKKNLFKAALLFVHRRVPFSQFRAFAAGDACS
jgi:hypothetical protein